MLHQTIDCTARAISSQNRRRTRALRTLAPGLRIGFAGDSILSGAGHGVAGERFAYRSHKFRLKPNRGAGSARTDQIAAQLPLVIADGANACILNGGVNDINAGVAAATIRANLIANWNALLSAGVLPIDVGQLPRDGAGGTNDARRLAQADLQLWRQLYCERNGIPHVNAWPQLANPDGTWATGMGDGGLHPVSPGLDALADRIVERLDAPGQSPRFLELIDRSAGIGGNCLRNAVSFGGVQSGSLPANWFASGSAGSPTYSVRAPDAGEFGNWLRCTFGESTGGAYVGFSATAATIATLGWNVGDRVAVGVRLKTSTDGPANLVPRVLVSAAANLFLLYDDHAGAAGEDYYLHYEYTIPASNNAVGLTAYAKATSAGSYFEINRPVIYNLTANGLA